MYLRSPTAITLEQNHLSATMDHLRMLDRYHDVGRGFDSCGDRHSSSSKVMSIFSNFAYRHSTSEVTYGPVIYLRPNLAQP